MDHGSWIVDHESNMSLSSSIFCDQTHYFALYCNGAGSEAQSARAIPKVGNLRLYLTTVPSMYCPMMGLVRSGTGSPPWLEKLQRPRPRPGLPQPTLFLDRWIICSVLHPDSFVGRKNIIQYLHTCSGGRQYVKRSESSDCHLSSLFGVVRCWDKVCSSRA
jgi:hypothetical protein